MHTVPLSDRMLSALASDAPTPEEAMIEAEERGQVATRRPRTWGHHDVARLEVAVHQLPRSEAIALGLWYRGQTQADIARELGMTQGGVSHLVHRGTLRLWWLTGPATWFSARDVERDLQPTLGAVSSELLRVWWETTSLAETARWLGSSRWAVWGRSRRLVGGRMPKLAQHVPVVRRYVRGFRELQAWGHELLSPRRQECRHGGDG